MSEDQYKIYNHSIAFFIGDKVKTIYGVGDGSPTMFAPALLHFVQTHSYADILAMVEEGDENVETQGSAMDVLNGKIVVTKCRSVNRSPWHYTFFFKEGRTGSMLNVHHVTKDGSCWNLERPLSTLCEQDFVNFQALEYKTEKDAVNAHRQILTLDEEPPHHLLIGYEPNYPPVYGTEYDEEEPPRHLLLGHD